MTTSELPPTASPDSNVNWGPYEIRPSPRKILWLTLGSSVAVATALVIPDAFSILPGAINILTWAMRVIGLWCSAYILWAAGFLAILHMTRIVTGGIQLDTEGVKLWRFGKKIVWKEIVATTISERKNFSRMLLISSGALELTLHVKKPNGKGLAVKKVPSFQYAPEDFASLVYYVGKFAFGITPSAVGVYMFKSADADTLLKASQEGRLKRLVLSSVITCSLLLYLARNAGTNYTFNMGNVYVRQGNYPKAIESYTMSTAINPFFPPAWDRLARCDLRAGDPDSAVEHWKRALQVKPDFVESKLGLSVIYMRRWQLVEAEKLIRQAVRLAPKDEASFINLAQIDSLMGKHQQALKILEQIILQNRGKEQARCLLAQCYLQVGDISNASKILLVDKHVPERIGAPFYSMVRAELALANGDLKTAAERLQKLYKGDKNVDLLLDMAKLKFAQGDMAACESLLREAEKKQLNGRNIDSDAASPFEFLSGVFRHEKTKNPTETPDTVAASGTENTPVSTTERPPPTANGTATTTNSSLASGQSNVPAPTKMKPDVTSYNPWISFYRAKIGFKRADKFEGTWMVEQALKSPFPDSSLMANCAILLLENGSTERARELTNQALKLDPENFFAKDAFKKLGQQR